MCSVTEQSMPSFVLTDYYLINSDQLLNYRELITLKISDMKLWNLLWWKKKLSVSLLTHFVWKSQTIEGTFLSFSFITEWMKLKEYMNEVWWFWRALESHCSLWNWYLSEVSVVIDSRIFEVLKIKFWTMYVPWGEVSLFVSLEIPEILRFSELSIYTEVVLLKSFLQHWIVPLDLLQLTEEFMKF